MIQKISMYPNGTYLKIWWSKSNTIIEGVLDTIYETDNGLDMNETGYQEFYACSIIVKKIISSLNPKKIGHDQLIELSKENRPTSIALQDDTIIWEQ